METYSDRLIKQYNDAPPDDEGFGKYGIWYEDVDPVTAAYMRELNINRIEDEIYCFLHIF